MDYTAGDIAALVRTTHPNGIDAFLDLTRDPAASVPLPAWSATAARPSP
jgi:hypothetical protein